MLKKKAPRTQDSEGTHKNPERILHQKKIVRKNYKNLMAILPPTQPFKLKSLPTLLSNP